MNLSIADLYGADSVYFRKDSSYFALMDKKRAKFRIESLFFLILYKKEESPALLEGATSNLNFSSNYPVISFMPFQ